MTVAELIEKLEEMPMDATVVVWGEEHGPREVVSRCEMEDGSVLID